MTLGVGMSGCALGRSTARDVMPRNEGCPVILLERSGGLGFESLSGIIAAVWPSGRIIRAEIPDRPWQGHVAGSLTAADRDAVLDLARSDQAWSQPSGQVVLDMPDDTLTLRRGDAVRRWGETPGFTSTAAVAEFRSRLVSLRIEGATRVSVSLETLAECR